MNRKCDYDQKRKLALANRVLLRKNRSNMKQGKDIQKRCGKGENFLSFIPDKGSSNFVYGKGKTTLSPSRQGRVVPLWKRLGKDLVIYK